MIAQVETGNSQKHFLSIASIISVHLLAGTVPVAAAEEAFTPCDDDPMPCCSSGAASYVGRVLKGQFPFLLGELLEAFRRRGLRVPEELLPELLDRAAKDTGIRPIVAEVCGLRGRWLAGLNENWNFLGTEIGSSDWETASRASRVLLLRKLRTTNPDAALSMLSGTWKQDASDDRIAFIAELEHGLTMADEEFLESALSDRRKEVRTKAAELLARLPQSKFVLRMCERLAALVKTASGTAPG